MTINDPKAKPPGGCHVCSGEPRECNGTVPNCPYTSKGESSPSDKLAPLSDRQRTARIEACRIRRSPPGDRVEWLAVDLLEALEARERELAEARAAVAWANNSLYGSHGYFLSANGGPADEHHLDRKIEELKAYGGEQWRRAEELQRRLDAPSAARRPVVWKDVKLPMEYEAPTPYMSGGVRDSSGELVALFHDQNVGHAIVAALNGLASPSSEVRWEFDRINRGVVMAEGIAVQATTEHEATIKAKKLMGSDTEAIRLRAPVSHARQSYLPGLRLAEELLRKNGFDKSALAVQVQITHLEVNPSLDATASAIRSSVPQFFKCRAPAHTGEINDVGYSCHTCGRTFTSKDPVGWACGYVDPKRVVDDGGNDGQR